MVQHAEMRWWWMDARGTVEVVQTRACGVADGFASARLAGIGLWTTVGFVTIVALPVIVRGAPLADDYVACVDVARRGLADHVRWMFQFTGVIRPARFLEVALIGTVCPYRHLGALIALSFATTVTIAFLVRSTLRDLQVPSPWPEIGGAIWLLQPLGAEAALWPSALHVPLGLALAVSALRLYRRDRVVLGACAGAAACLCVEQVIFALPAAAWLVAPRASRVRALVAAAITSALILVAYRAWPGSEPRAPLAVSEMIGNVFRGPFFYVRFLATSLGTHSIPLAIAWAFPVSVGVLVAGVVVGAFVGRRLLASTPSRGATGRSIRSLALVAVGIAVLLNIPVVVTFPHANSGRVFTPTWLMLAIVGAMAGSRLQWHRPRLAGGMAGMLAAGALLSLALSSSVRVRTADIAQASFQWLGTRVPAHGVIAICDVRRAMVPNAPTGDFHTSEFLHIWLAESALIYHSGVVAEVRQGGQYWQNRCPDIRGADVVVTPDEMLDGARRDAASARTRP